MTNEVTADAEEKGETVKADPAQTHVDTQWQTPSPLVSCRFDPTGKYVVVGGEDYTLQRWDLTSGTAISFKGPHDSWVRSLGFSPDGQTLYSGGYDGRLVWWPASAETPEPIRTVQAHDGWLRSLSVSPDGSQIASCGNDRLVKLWNAADGSLIRELVGHEHYVYSTLFHPNGEILLSGDLKGVVKQWNIADGSCARDIAATPLYSQNSGQGVDYGGVRALSISPDGKYLAAGGLHKATNPLGAVNEPLVLLVDWEKGEVVHNHVTEGVNGMSWRLIHHPDGYLISGTGGGGGGWIMYFNADQDREFFRFQMPNTVRDMDLHPDGIRIATAHYDRHIRISRMISKPA
ncbi:MAG: WD40 repeat domain-containing protein [Planctomycetota bacterium]|nr:WD40 repeat domain-containing protein [Planctomycetota bacterium]MDA1214437.1 WD40 repeat domain-containing protein [Planctomycetota bacterium]